MDPVIQWLSENLVAAIFLAILLGTLIIVAFIQRRELTVGKIFTLGPPTTKEPDKKEKDRPGPSQNNEIFKNSATDSPAPKLKLGSHHKEIYEDSNDEEFANEIIELFSKAHRIVLIGTGFYVFQFNDKLRGDLSLVSADREVEIYAANPFSPNVETRLIEEETGNPSPNIGRAGLKRWLGGLLTEKESNPSAKFSLQLFPFYPTYAFFVFYLSDERHYFFYPYGYAQLGTRSPVLHYISRNPDHQAMIRFLDKQYELIKKRSADAELIFNLHPFNKERVDKNVLTPFAVYLIPASDSRLYKFGSEILEYDVRAKKELKENAEPLHNAIGAAFDYGLHVTIADALYCVTKSEIDLICREVEFLANEFRPFTFKLSLEKDFPNEQGIALVCHDKTGSLEALHHEMVARVYRKAVASNYNFEPGLANRDKDEERAKLMIKHYHAPYILQRFKPHFSLLSAVPPEQKEIIYKAVKASYEEKVRDLSIEIGKIAVMHRPDPRGHWKILQEYPLGGVA